MSRLGRRLIRKLLIAASVLALLTSCASHRPAPDYPLRESIVENALGQVGRPYQYGGDDPDGFDCSGLVEYIYSQAGVKVPRDTVHQRDAGTHIGMSDALPGDLLFYRFPDAGLGLHVAIYLGDGQMVHSPASGKQVSVVRIDQRPWSEWFIGAVRIIP
jgi:cell wall-associated NlpC family hydrolase